MMRAGFYVPALVGCCLPVAVEAAVIAADDFDVAVNLTRFSVDPDLSANNGFFGDLKDAFGVTNRPAMLAAGSGDAILDASLDGDYSVGIIRPTKTDNFFAVADVDNRDNPNGTYGTASWQFDIGGADSLTGISIDMAAMGDFERGGDAFSFEYAIDAGPFIALFDITADDSASLVYTMENAEQVVLDDPLFLDGRWIDNGFRTFSAALTGSGSVMTLRFSATQNGADEVYGFDNIVVEGVLEPAASVPVPGSISLLAVGLLAMRRHLG
jgi:hypothetical protein